METRFFENFVAYKRVKKKKKKRAVLTGQSSIFIWYFRGEIRFPRYMHAIAIAFHRDNNNFSTYPYPSIYQRFVRFDSHST